MTVQSNDTIERYTVSGTGPYPFSFRIFDDTDLSVSALAPSGIDPVPLSSGDYTVTGENDTDGGSITLTSGAATTYSGYTLDIRSNTPISQPTSIKNQGTFLPVVHETAFDRIDRQVQDLARQVRQSFRYPDNVNLDAVMTNRSSWLSSYTFVNSSGILEPSPGISSVTLTQSVIGSLLYPRTAAEIAAPVTPVNYYNEPRPWYDAKRLGCALDGSTDDYTALNNIVTMAGSTNIGIVIDGPMLVGTNITLPRNIQLWFVGNGKIKPSSNKTITVNSKIQAGPWQIFDCSNSGAVIAGSLGGGQVFVNWWGAVDDDSTDNVAAILAAATAIAARTKGGIIYFPYTHSGVYRYTGTLYHYGSFVRFVGEGRGIYLTKTDTGTMLSASPTAHTGGTYTYYTNCSLENIYLSSTTADIGIDYSGYAYSTFRGFEIFITGNSKKLLYGVGEQGSAPYYNLFDDFALFGNNNGSTSTGSIGISMEEGAWSGGSNGPNANFFTNLRRAASLDYMIDVKAGNGNHFGNISGESIHEAYIRLNQRSADDSGTSSGSGAVNTFIDSGKSWTVNDWVSATVKITGGTGSGQSRRISANNGTTLTLEIFWTTLPDNTSTYEIYRGKAHNNKFSHLRGEGLSTSNPDFILSKPGAYKNTVDNYSVDSLGSGLQVNDVQKDPSNKYFDGDVITLPFLSTGIAAGTTIALTPTAGAAYYQGGYGLTGQFIVEQVNISCEGRSAGTATVTVTIDNSYTLAGVIDANKPDHIYIAGNTTIISGTGKKIHVSVTTDGSWAPTTADISVLVSVRMLP